MQFPWNNPLDPPTALWYEEDMEFAARPVTEDPPGF
jgi:hypothetical protein